MTMNATKVSQRQPELSTAIGNARKTYQSVGTSPDFKAPAGRLAAEP
jgi:hypothetical protein